MGVLALAVVTLVLASNARTTWRAARTAPHRRFRWLNRVLVVAVPVFLAASWLAVATSGPVHGLFTVASVAAGVVGGAASLGLLLVFATAPSCRR